MRWIKSEVIRQKTDCTRERWVFLLLDDGVVLDSYYEEYREFKRHKWKEAASYQRLSHNNRWRAQIANPPRPLTVMAEGLAGIRSQIQFHRNEPKYTSTSETE